MKLLEDILSQLKEEKVHKIQILLIYTQEVLGEYIQVWILRKLVKIGKIYQKGSISHDIKFKILERIPENSADMMQGSLLDV